MTSARSAARALRVRAAEDELRKVAERVSVAGGLVEAEKAALRMLEVCAYTTIDRGVVPQHRAGTFSGAQQVQGSYRTRL